MRLVTKREEDSTIAATSGRPKKRDLWVVYTEKTRLRGGGGGGSSRGPTPCACNISMRGRP